MKKLTLNIIILVMITLCCFSMAKADNLYYGSVPSYDQAMDDVVVKGRKDLKGVCRHYSVAMVLGFWDAHSFKRFVPYGSASYLMNPTGVKKLASDVRYYTETAYGNWGYTKLNSRINYLSKRLDSKANFKTSYSNKITWNSWNLVKNSLGKYGPGNFITEKYSYIKTYYNGGGYNNTDWHAMTSQGYYENYVKHNIRAHWLLVKSTWTNSSTKLDPMWINWADIKPANKISYLHFFAYGSPSSSRDTTDDSYEDNDSLKHAKAVSANYLYSSLKNNDHDWYKVYVRKGSKLYVSIGFWHSKGNLNLRLYNSSGKWVALSGSGKNNYEAVSTIASKSGYYYIVVYCYNCAKNSGTYNMKVIERRR